MSKKIISFSVYGNKDKYVGGMFENLKRAKIIYPGWRVRIYTETKHPAIRDFKLFGAEIAECGSNDVHSGAFWRFFAAEDPEAELVIFRDSDSRLGNKEKAAVDDWIASGRKAHLMFDHQHHVPAGVMAGMWGVKGGVLPGIKDAIIAYGQKIAHMDTRFLEQWVYPKIKGSHLVHGYKGNPFPAYTPDDIDYVGQIWDSPTKKDLTRNEEM